MYMQIRAADIVIDNGGSLAELSDRVDEAWERAFNMLQPRTLTGFFSGGNKIADFLV
jgi:hypothetical protein